MDLHFGGHERRELRAQLCATETRAQRAAHLVDKEHTRNKFRDTLLNVPIHHAVDLATELVRHFCPTTLDKLTDDAHDILTTLRTCIGHVQIVQRHVLDHFFALVHLALGKSDVLFRFQIEFGRVCVRTAYALRAQVGERRVSGSRAGISDGG